MAARLELGILRAVWLEASGVEVVFAGSGRELDGIFRLGAELRHGRAVGAWDLTAVWLEAYCVGAVFVCRLSKGIGRDFPLGA